MDANTVLSLVVGLMVVLFIGKFVGKALKDGGCGPIIFALIFIGIIVLAAMNFAK